METSLISATLAQVEPALTCAAPLCVEAPAEVQWYAAYTSAHHEKRVAQQLEWRSVEHLLFRVWPDWSGSKDIRLRCLR